MIYLILCGIIGILIGVPLVLLVAMKRAQSRLFDAERRISAAEATATELRRESGEIRGKAADDFERLRVQLSSESEARVRAETERDEFFQRLEAERKLLAEAKEKLTDTFKALAGETLHKNADAFLLLAKETFEKVLVEARGDLGKRQEAISGLVKPISESLQKFDDQVRKLEVTRQEAYTGLKSHLEGLTATQENLRKETTNLVTALRAPQVRGRWGELTLTRVVQLAGMSDHCDFTEQFNVSTEEGRIRPDLIIHLPDEREVVIDAKVSLDAYLEAVSAELEQDRRNALARHAAQTRAHVAVLSAKNYWAQFAKTPEFVVMFIPGESFFAAALDSDPGLIEDALEKRVVLATPTTLIALLRSVAYGWRQQSIAKNAQLISDLGRQLYERMKILAEHISNIGTSLGKANQAYNSAVGSIESRVLSAARRFKELGATGSDEIPTVELLDNQPRQLLSSELKD